MRFHHRSVLEYLADEEVKQVPKALKQLLPDAGASADKVTAEAYAAALDSDCFRLRTELEKGCFEMKDPAQPNKPGAAYKIGAKFFLWCRVKYENRTDKPMLAALHTYREQTKFIGWVFVRALNEEQRTCVGTALGASLPGGDLFANLNDRL